MGQEINKKTRFFAAGVVISVMIGAVILISVFWNDFFSSRAVESFDKFNKTVESLKFFSSDQKTNIQKELSNLRGNWSTYSKEEKIVYFLSFSAKVSFEVANSSALRNYPLLPATNHFIDVISKKYLFKSDDDLIKDTVTDAKSAVTKLEAEILTSEYENLKNYTVAKEKIDGFKKLELKTIDQAEESISGIFEACQNVVGESFEKIPEKLATHNEFKSFLVECRSLLKSIGDSVEKVALKKFKETLDKIMKKAKAGKK